MRMLQVPLVILLKAMGGCTDREIYERLLQGDVNNSFLSARLELLLQEAKVWGVGCESAHPNS